MKKRLQKYFTRFIAIFILFFLINIGLFVLGYSILNAYGIDAEKTIAYLDRQMDEQDQLSEEGKDFLEKEHIWMMLLDEKGDIAVSYQLPSDLNHSYGITQVAMFSRWYIEGYPVVERIRGNDLLVIGYDKDEFMGIKITKLYYVTDSRFMSGLILVICLLFVCNIVALFLLFRLNARSIEEHVEEEFLKKDKARAEWINGVTHDIRTPLSLILGYAVSLEEAVQEEHGKRQANQIRKQAQKVKELIIDLNLVSKLEYAMQPLRLEKLDLLELLRSILIDYIENQDGSYDIIPELPESGDFMIQGDASLLRRMMENLINNSICHNEKKTILSVSLLKTDGKYQILLTEKESSLNELQLERMNQNMRMDIEKLYDVNGDSAHGVGLQLVKDTIIAHGGDIYFIKREDGGLSIKIELNPSYFLL